MLQFTCSTARQQAGQNNQAGACRIDLLRPDMADRPQAAGCSLCRRCARITRILVVAMQSFRLDFQIALVTSASSGLGAAIAVALAEAGADVAAHETDRCPDETCARVRHVGRRAVPNTGNLADASEPARLVADALGAFGHLDILVSHAYVRSAADSLQQDSALDDLLAGRLSSTFRLCRAFGTYLRQAERHGRIINLASPRDRQEGPGRAASNGGIAHFTRALAREWAPHGIAVNAIAP